MICIGNAVSVTLGLEVIYRRRLTKAFGMLLNTIIGQFTYNHLVYVKLLARDSISRMVLISFIHHLGFFVDGYYFAL